MANAGSNCKYFSSRSSTKHQRRQMPSHACATSTCGASGGPSLDSCKDFLDVTSSPAWQSCGCRSGRAMSVEKISAQTDRQTGNYMTVHGVRQSTSHARARSLSARPLTCSTKHLHLLQALPPFRVLPAADLKLSASANFEDDATRCGSITRVQDTDLC